MDRATRFGVSLPRKLLERFDKTIMEACYSNRSKAIADAITEFIVSKKQLSGEKIIGSISFVYNHHTGDVTEKLTRLQHDHEEVIKSSMHAHITHEKCLEVIIVSGNPREIQKLGETIAATRGVDNCKTSILG